MLTYLIHPLCLGQSVILPNQKRDNFFKAGSWRKDVVIYLLCVQNDISTQPFFPSGEAVKHKDV